MSDPARLTWPLLAIAALGCGAATEPPAPAADAGSPPVAVAMPEAAAGGFTEVTAAAGIHSRHRLPTDDIDNIVDSLGGGAAFADLDGDGWLDLIVLGGPDSPLAGAAPGAGVRVHRNRGDGTFVDDTGRSRIPADRPAVAVAVADVDGDGDRDVYLLDRGPNRLYLNRGDGVFEDASAVSGIDDDRFSVGAVFFDMDGDADLDLYVTNYLQYDAFDTPHFAPDGFPGPLAYRVHADAVFRNRGDGRFEDVSQAAGVSGLTGRGMSVVAADFDDSGSVDVFVANDATANFLLLNDGSGHFRDAGFVAGVAMSESGEATAAMGGDLGDVDGDGHLDLAVSDTAFGALYRRLDAGMYGDVVMASGLAQLVGQYVSWGQSLLDHDNDGDLDLFIANGGMHHLVGWEDVLASNDGDGHFSDASLDGGPHFQSQRVSRASIAGDYDNDGDVDLFVTTLADAPVLLRNDQPGEASWLTIDLVGTVNRDPFGARVEVTAGSRTQVALGRCPSVYLGQSDPRLHFGLGEGVERVERVRVRWPDGSETVLRDVPARQILRLEQGGQS